MGYAELREGAAAADDGDGAWGGSGAVSGDSGGECVSGELGYGKDELDVLRPIFLWMIVATVGAVGLGVLYERHYKTKTYAWFKLAPKEDNGVLERIEELRRNGDFEGAGVLALNGIDGKPPDDFLLQTVSYTYFERAQAEPAKRSQWVGMAVQYSERALQANPGDVVNVFNVGESYAIAGMNLSKPEACVYYEKALDIFEHLKTDPILKNDRAIIEGEGVPTEPYRVRLDAKIEQVKMLHDSCR